MAHFIADNLFALEKIRTLNLLQFYVLVNGMGRVRFVIKWEELVQLRPAPKECVRMMQEFATGTPYLVLILLSARRIGLVEWNREI